MTKFSEIKIGDFFVHNERLYLKVSRTGAAPQLGVTTFDGEGCAPESRDPLVDLQESLSLCEEEKSS